MTSSTTFRLTSSPTPPHHDLVPFPSDRARLELVRGGLAHCAPSALADATVSVIVLASDARTASGAAVRGALAQTHPVCEVLVVGPDWSAAARAALAHAGGGDPRVRLLVVPRPGLAPAAPRSRRFVRAAQYLRAALPHVAGDWIAVLSEPAAPAPTYLAALLQRARDGSELVHALDHDTPEGTFGGTLFAAGLALLAPHDHAGWDSMPADRMWWERLADAGARVAPGKSFT